MSPPPIIAFECEFFIEPPMKAKLVIEPATMDEVQRFYGSLSPFDAREKNL